MDAVTTFMPDNLADKEIFIKQPERFQNDIQPRKVCRLQKTLYSLKLAGYGTGSWARSSSKWNSSDPSMIRRSLIG